MTAAGASRCPLEYVVQEADPATPPASTAWATGARWSRALADLNLIDYERLALSAPYVMTDLPAGRPPPGPEGHGYVATIKSGR